PGRPPRAASIRRSTRAIPTGAITSAGAGCACRTSTRTAARGRSPAPSTWPRWWRRGGPRAPPSWSAGWRRSASTRARRSRSGCTAAPARRWASATSSGRPAACSTPSTASSAAGRAPSRSWRRDGGGGRVSLAAIDVVIIAVYLAIVVAIGLWFARRASGGLTDYFNAGRRMPWYLIGTSMAATPLAADTPPAVTALVRQGALAGAWSGWSAAIGTVTAAVFFSRLWRRSGVLTDAELVELRYAGRPAAALRATRAAYLALPVNCLILGWVIFAMVSIVETVAGVRGDVVLPVILLLAIGYSTASGMWGVVATDAFQMVVAVVGLVLLAGFSVAAAGGLDALAALPAETTALVPSSSSALLPLEVFAVYLGMQWWATRNADGGEYIGL